MYMYYTCSYIILCSHIHGPGGPGCVVVFVYQFIFPVYT